MNAMHPLLVANSYQASKFIFAFYDQDEDGILNGNDIVVFQ